MLSGSSGIKFALTSVSCDPSSTKILTIWSFIFPIQNSVVIKVELTKGSRLLTQDTHEPDIPTFRTKASAGSKYFANLCGCLTKCDLGVGVEVGVLGAICWLLG